MAIQGMQSITSFYPSRQLLRTHLSELSSGKKSVSTTSPALLAIGQRMLDMASTTSVANSNVNFATSRSQTIDSYLQNSSDVISRLKELSVQSANGTLTDVDREAIDAEANELLKGLDLNYHTANFNGQKILQGGSESVAVTGDGETLNVRNGDVSRTTLGLEDIDLSTMEGATAALDALDDAMDSLGEQRANVGTDLNTLEGRYQANMDYESNLVESGSKLTDVDYAFSSTNLASADIRSQVALAVAAQGNALQGSMITALL